MPNKGTLRLFEKKLDNCEIGAKITAIIPKVLAFCQSDSWRARHAAAVVIALINRILGNRYPTGDRPLVGFELHVVRGTKIREDLP